MEKTLAVLICAHAIADFLLQPGWLAERKRKCGYLLLHASIHAVVAYLALQAWRCWELPAVILLTHALIDSIKQRQNDSVTLFVVDQLAHMLVLFVLVTGLCGLGAVPPFTGAGYRLMVIVGGFIATVQGSGFLIGKFTKRLLDENELELDGLKNGGKVIGQLERALIFAFIFIGHPEGIGFLVAAKSILRFEEAKKSHKLTEYILIGTLLSFTVAIVLASATKWALGLK